MPTLSFFGGDFWVEWSAGNSDHRNTKQVDKNRQKQGIQIKIHVVYTNKLPSMPQTAGWTPTKEYGKQKSLAVKYWHKLINNNFTVMLSLIPSHMIADNNSVWNW